MQTESPDSFVISTRPLFKKRKYYRLIFYFSLFLLLISIDSWFFIPCLIFVFFVIGKLGDAEFRLSKRVWGRFSAQLDSVNGSGLYNFRPTPLSGVMGSIGDRRYLSLVTGGVYGAYDIRLLEQTVSFNTDSKKGSFSRSYRILEITTSQNFYHVFIDSRRNHQRWFSTAMNVLSLSLRSNKPLSVEGDVNKYFDIYVPSDDRFKSLVTLSPEKLLALRDYGAMFDVEFVDNKIYVITSTKMRSVKDIIIYQQNALDLVANIGVDVIRSRDDIHNSLVIKTPTVLSL